MGLTNIRKQINTIDDSMKKLFDDRLNCSLEVAKVKMCDNDDIYKPAREVEICERYMGEESYLIFIKKIMQISRKFQYRTFLENDVLYEDFEDYASKHYSDVFSGGGKMDIYLKADSESKNGLNVNDILSVISDTKLKISKLSVDGATDEVYICLDVPDDEKSKKEARILACMLFKETIKA